MRWRRRQHELGMKFGTLVQMADQLQIYKYVVHNVAHSYGKTATFMPKPIYGDNGSGMHCHQSIWKAGKPLFAGNGYADLSETRALLHRRHHQARQGAQRLHQPDDQQLQAADPGLRGAGAAGLFGPQPLGLVPHPLRHQPEGQARRGPLPRCRRQPLPRLLGHADGRPRRHPEQDPSRRPDGQEPLRPAAGRAEGHPDGLRQPARGDRRAGSRPRVPARRRRVLQRPDRQLSRAEVERGLPLRAHPAPRSSSRCTTRSDLASSDWPNPQAHPRPIGAGGFFLAASAAPVLDADTCTCAKMQVSGGDMPCSAS